MASKKELERRLTELEQEVTLLNLTAITRDHTLRFTRLLGRNERDELISQGYVLCHMFLKDNKYSEEVWVKKEDKNDRA